MLNLCLQKRHVGCLYDCGIARFGIELATFDISQTYTALSQYYQLIWMRANGTLHVQNTK